MELASQTLEFAYVLSIFDSFLAVGCMAGGAVMQCFKRSLAQLIFSMGKNYTLAALCQTIIFYGLATRLFHL